MTYDIIHCNGYNPRESHHVIFPGLRQEPVVLPVEEAGLLRAAVRMYYTVLCCTVLYCTVLCCAVLCCAVLCCTVLHYNML